MGAGNSAAVELGALGGRETARRRTPDQRAVAARHAAEGRWSRVGQQPARGHWNAPVSARPPVAGQCPPPGRLASWFAV